jgi:hypothetical protein
MTLQTLHRAPDRARASMSLITFAAVKILWASGSDLGVPLFRAGRGLRSSGAYGEGCCAQRGWSIGSVLGLRLSRGE